MRVHTRKEFRVYFNRLRHGLGDTDSPLWMPEQVTGQASLYFVNIKPVDDVDEFNRWCYQYCSGNVLCYSWSDEEVWFGFTHKADILNWTLRWA